MSGTVQTTKTRHRRPSYLLIFAALTLFTVAEVFIAFDAGPWRNPALLGASAVKAALVIAYFMHLRYDSRWYLLIFAVPFLFAGALFLVIHQ